jgi:hypothetical protein
VNYILFILKNTTKVVSKWECVSLMCTLTEPVCAKFRLFAVTFLGTSVSGLRFMFFVFNREIIIIANNEHSTVHNIC